MAIEDKPFLGKGWGFPPTFTIEGRSVEMVRAETDIKQCLEILLQTIPGERIMQPRFGSELTALLFEPMDVTFSTYIKDRIANAILLYEPRIVLDNIEITQVPNEGRIDIEVIFTVTATNTRNNIVFPFYLNEGTNIG